MEIRLPKELTYGSVVTMLRTSYEASRVDGASACSFDWSDTEWAALPEIVLLLNWSAELVSRQVQVVWIFPIAGSEPSGGLDNMRSLIRGQLGEHEYATIERQFADIRKRAIRGELFTSARRAQLEKLEHALSLSHPKHVRLFDPWFRHLRASFAHLDLLGYLDRYQVFARAKECGIRIVPEQADLPKARLERSEGSPCIELISIQSALQVTDVIEQLRDPTELARVLGEYAGLDVVRRGALAQILVLELGNNVAEHAGSSAAWLCTRVVPLDGLAKQARTDPVVRAFRERNTGFLEVIVCDNGGGLTSRLQEVIRGDRRASVRAKYKAGTNGAFTTVDLVDYAFDRLSSSKRDISQLLNVAGPGVESSAVPSGLYWVWNVVRSHQGILSVRTADACCWYDFASDAGGGKHRVWALPRLQRADQQAPYPGTMFRICLPLSGPSALDPSKEWRTVGSLTARTRERASKTKIVWVGDLARQARLTHTTGEDPALSRAQQSFIWTESEYQLRVLGKLQDEHSHLADGDILVLDLCGASHPWAKDTAAPLCRFFLEMNYTSTVGRSTVVLWNIPSDAIGIFEQAIELFQEPYQHLKDFRRGAVLISDTGSMRIISGWAAADEMLGNLAQGSDLHLDELGAAGLEGSERARLVNFITENSHLFEWEARDRVRLRPLPDTIEEAAWREAIKWFEAVLDTPVDLGGAHHVAPRGYCRLPESGLLSTEYYQFSAVISDQYASSRLAWMVGRLVAHWETSNGGIDHLITVSRPVIEMAHSIATSEKCRAAVIAVSTIDELRAEARRLPPGSKALLFLDILETDETLEEVHRAAPEALWIGTIALVDIRPAEPGAAKTGSASSFPEPSAGKTGPIRSLAKRPIHRLHPSEVDRATIQAIDRITHSPIVSVARFPDARYDVWPFLERRESSLRVGHFRSGNYHHYVYYLDPKLILDTPDPRGGIRLLDHFVDDVVDHLRESKCAPEDLVILHPPAEASDAEFIAKAIQKQCGAIYRHVVHRDSFAGQWRFSPFVAHGPKLDGKTVILVDDGTNTGDTLMGLLHVATMGRPQRILICGGITRIPPHKAHLLGGIRRLHRVKDPVKMLFAVGLNVPVYTRATCPVCAFRDQLGTVGGYCRLLTPSAERCRAESEAISVSEVTAATGVPWRYASAAGAARLRQAIEMYEYHAESAALVDAMLRESCDLDEPLGRSALLDLAFNICAEPDLIEAPVFGPYSERLLHASASRIADCEDSQVLTLFRLSHHLSRQVARTSKADAVVRMVVGICTSILGRPAITNTVLGQLVVLVLADVVAADGEAGADETNSNASLWLSAIAEAADALDAVENASRMRLIKVFIRLYRREASLVLRATETHQLQLSATTTPTTLYELANLTAANFWWHATERVKVYMDLLVQKTGDRVAATDAVGDPTEQLLVAFDQLHELRQRLCDLDECLLQELRESGDLAQYWRGSRLRTAIAEFGNSFVEIAESTGYDAKVDPAIVSRLRSAWETLNPLLTEAFDAIFPRTLVMISARWAEFDSISRLPLAIAQLPQIGPGVAPAGLGSQANDTVFFPKTLLSRFLSAAIGNLGTAAFAKWSPEELQNARADIEINTEEDPELGAVICIAVIDNGGDVEHEGSPGQGRGLAVIEAAARVFGGRLTLPYVHPETRRTRVELRVRHRAYRPSAG